MSTKSKAAVATVDPVWDQILAEAKVLIEQEPLLASSVYASIYHQKSLEASLSYRIAQKLKNHDISGSTLTEEFHVAYEEEPELGKSARADIRAYYERDPACHFMIQPLLFFKGYQSVQAYRLANYFWRTGRRYLAYFVQMRTSESFGVDIHPAAKIGRGLMIDHAHSVVIGETAVVGDNVSMLHSVTLGGTGKEQEDRHPKIGDGVLIGAGAAVLGNIRVGNNAKIASGSVVLKEVPPCKTVAGVPAMIVGDAGCDQPSVDMDQMLHDEDDIQ